MKLILKNFRCYEKKEFDFQKGLTLISGESGIGKTSIFMAILFVLYDKGTKIIMFGKKSCSVTLVLDDLTITRTKSPNKLIVNNKYEDDVGQKLINTKFGNDIFESVSYLPQFPVNSFVLLTPINKLQFLEKFAFKDVNLKNIKQKLKEHTKQIENNLLEYKSKIEVTTQVLKETKLPTITFEKKLDIMTTEELEKLISEEISVKERIQDKIENSKITLQKLNEKLKYVSLFNMKLETMEENLHTNEQTKNKLQTSINNINYKGDEYLNNINTKLEKIKINKDFLSDKQKLSEQQETLDSVKEEERNILLKEIAETTDSLLEDEEKKEIQEQIEILQVIINTINTVNRLKGILYDLDENDLLNMETQLSELNTELITETEIYNKLRTNSVIYSCPSCKSNLRIKNDKLHLCNDDFNPESLDIETVSRKISSLKENINRLQNSIFSFKEKSESNKTNQNKIEVEMEKIIDYEIEDDIDLEDYINDLENYKQNMKDDKTNKKILTDLKFKLENKIYSKTCNKLEKQVSELKNKLKLVNTTDIPDDDENVLRTEYYEQKRISSELDIYNNQLDSVLDTIEKTKIDIVNLKNNYKYTVSTTVPLLEKEIKDSNINDKILKDEFIKLSSSIENKNDYLQYKKEFETYNKWKLKLNDLIEKETNKQQEYHSCLLLKKKILQAESIIIIEVIKNLNKHTQFYLDIFFKENPMTINISPFKIVKKVKKPQIEIVFYYKGMECQINMLSGGEMARVILAFTLALGDIFNISLLLLDECTANLNESLTNEVFDCIKNNSNAKHILAIAHQVVKGEFDNVLDL